MFPEATNLFLGLSGERVKSLLTPTQIDFSGKWLMRVCVLCTLSHVSVPVFPENELNYVLFCSPLNTQLGENWLL